MPPAAWLGDSVQVAHADAYGLDLAGPGSLGDARVCVVHHVVEAEPGSHDVERVVGQEEGRRIGATAADEDARRKLRKQIYTKSLQRGATTEEAKDCK